MNNRAKSLRLGLVPGLFLACAALAIFAAQAKAQSLGTAETFAALGGSTLTNTGTSNIVGNVGGDPIAPPEAERANRRLLYDPQGHFVAAEADDDRDGRFIRLSPGTTVIPPGGTSR